MRPLMRLVGLLVVGGLLASPLLGRASAGRNLSALPENQQGQGATAGRNEVLRTFHTFFIQSKTVYLRGPVLGQALRQRPEFGAWGLAEAETPEAADVTIEVTLPILSFEWNYRLLHRASGTLLASGKVSAALEKTAAPKLAEEITRQIGVVGALPEGFSVVRTPPVTTEPKTTAAAAIGAAVGRSWRAEYARRALHPALS